MSSVAPVANRIDLSQYLDTAIGTLKVLQPLLSWTKADDEALEALVAVRASQPLLDYFQRKINGQATTPDRAMSMMNPNDTELTAAFLASPQSLEMVAKMEGPLKVQKSEETPDYSTSPEAVQTMSLQAPGGQNFSIGDLPKFISIAQLIWQLISQWRKTAPAPTS